LAIAGQRPIFLSFCFSLSSFLLFLIFYFSIFIPLQVPAHNFLRIFGLCATWSDKDKGKIKKNNKKEKRRIGFGKKTPWLSSVGRRSES